MAMEPGLAASFLSVARPAALSVSDACRIATTTSISIALTEAAMSKRFRIAVGGFLHESNTFVPGRGTLASFRSGGGYPGMCFGDAVLTSLEGVNCGLSGFIEAA